jgi:predicted AAA+ superfamily ATPase
VDRHYLEKFLEKIKQNSSSPLYMVAETNRQMKETDRKIGALGSRLGEVIEHIMTPGLYKKFKALGYQFNHSSRNHELQDQRKQRMAEIDILLENGEYAMAVEVKTRLTAKDVKDHVKRMDILRRIADEHHGAGPERRRRPGLWRAVPPQARFIRRIPPALS